MKKIWVYKAKSLNEARRFEIAYYLSMPPFKRLETLQYLRENVFKLRSGIRDAKSRKKFRRVIKVIQQA